MINLKKWQIPAKSLVLAGILILINTGCFKIGRNKHHQAIADPTIKSDRLTEIKQRGYLVCGVNGRLPGFSFIDKDDRYAGLDVDICRAISAAIFDDPDKVEFRDLDNQQRFPAVESGAVDLLSRNTTYTLSRDTSLQIEFSPTTFYDGQAIIIDRTSGIKQISDLEGKSICVQSNNTNKQNLADWMEKQNIQYTPVLSDSEEDLFNKYEQKHCQAVTGDSSGLIVRRTLLAMPSDHVTLPEIISKEPLGPVVSSEDQQWVDIVKWATFALIQAEELGINSQNFISFNNTRDSEIQQFLGQSGNLGRNLGLTNNFALRIIKHVGNYGEIYDRNIGEPFELERGLNNLWTKGGLLYSPPFR